MMRFNLFLFLLLIGFIAKSQDTLSYLADPNSAPREHSVDFTHLKLELAFEPDSKLVRGRAVETFTVLQKEIDTLFLDGIKIKFFDVFLDNKPVNFSSSDDGITLRFEKPLKWDTKHKIRIDYEANPTKGLYFIGWDDSTGRSRKQIWTQGQGIDNRHWIPMFDERNDKLVSEVIVSFDSNYQVLSNGKLQQNVIAEGGEKKWHYKISNPHAPYLIMLGIGEYAIKKDTSFSGIPLEFYYYSDEPEQFEPTYRFSKEMFQFFENEIGVPYPWEVYSQIPVQNFMYGAMENTTATIFGDFYLVDSSGFLDRNYVRVNAHELAHQWFGNSITARSSKHHWLQESFATHYDMMYQKEAFGQDYFDGVRRNYNDQSIAASVKDLRPLAHSQAGSTRHYPKGAFVLQMLKYVVGQDQFNAAIKYYLEKHAYQNVDSDDLLTAFHERLGLSLDWFWEDWIYQGGEPRYKVDFESKKGNGTFQVVQQPEESNLTGLFKMPINFEVHFEDGNFLRKRVWVEKDTTVVNFSLQKKKISFVLFDPNSEIMKSVDFKKPVNQLKSQAAHAQSMLDRYDAIVALDSIDFKKKQEFLAERFEAENFQLIKGEILKQIAENENELTNRIFSAALKSKDAEVRKVALPYLSNLTANQLLLVENLLQDSSYEIVAIALEILSLQDLPGSQKYLDLTKNLEGNRSENIRITWLKIAAVVYEEKEYVNDLVDYTSNSYEFITRIEAFNALKEINYLSDELLGNLVEARFHFNSTLRRSANNTLKAFYAIEDYKKPIVAYIETQELPENQMKALQRLMED